MSQTPPEFVTCLCRSCSGQIEFELALFDPEDPAVIACPHCGVETQLYLPGPQAGNLAAQTPPPAPTPPNMFAPAVKAKHDGPRSIPAVKAKHDGPRSVLAVKAKRYGRRAVVAGLVAGLILLAVWLANRLGPDSQERSKVQITSQSLTNDSASAAYAPTDPLKAFVVSVRNDSRFTIRDIRITWVFNSQSDTKLGNFDFTFQETVEPGNTRIFQTPFGRLELAPDTAVKASIRDFKFVK
jgi:hypothetical protein